MRYLFIITAIFLFSSCETNWGKYGGYAMDYDSALDYYIILDKGKTIYLTDSYNDRLNKGVFIKYFYNKKTIVDSLLTGKGSPVINSFVDDVSFNNVFILVDQKPLDSICICTLECLKVKYKNWRELPTYKLCKEALERSTFHHYWIINKLKDYVYGPLTKKEYLLRRKELGIAPGLKLEFE